jgi:4-hydroxy-tetrahydrodipicolinate synthase
MGAKGAISASASVGTSRFAAMIDAALNGRLDEGREHHEALLPLTQALFAEPSPAVIKAVLHAQGRIATPDVRMPLSNASAAATERALAVTP